MSTMVTGSPPLGQAAPRGHAVPGGLQAHGPRRGFRLPRTSTTPGRLWLVRAGLVVLCLAWGVLATLMINQHTSAAHQVTASGESLSLDAQQMYQSLADADVMVSTGYLYGRTEPFSYRQRYQHDIAAASADLKAVTAANGNSGIGASLSAISQALPVYTGYVEDGEIYNSLGFPAGGSFIEVASEQMHLTLLPAARSVYEQENAELQAASAQATGLPLAVITVVVGLAVCFLLFRAQRWLSRRTHRTINTGLLFATLASLAALVWLVAALAGAAGGPAARHRARLGPAQTLAQADITALQARGDETLNLISRSRRRRLPAGLPHRAAARWSTGAGQRLGAEPRPTAPRRSQPLGTPRPPGSRSTSGCRQLDAVYDYGAETQLEIGSGPGTARDAVRPAGVRHQRGRSRGSVGVRRQRGGRSRRVHRPGGRGHRGACPGHGASAAPGA